jgi:hypothetical protein
LYQNLISASPEFLSGTILKDTLSLMGTPDIFSSRLLMDILRYAFTVLSSLRTNISFVEINGFGSTKSLNRDLLLSKALKNLSSGISPVTL